MPINSDLNKYPYYDDFDYANQYHRVLFKPGYAVQARELTQLQSILQNQVEQFGDNIFKEGSIIKGCNFTELRNLQYVRLIDKSNFNPTAFVGAFEDDTDPNNVRTYYYMLEGAESGLLASIESAAQGTQTNFPDLNTFFIHYKNSSSGSQVFQAGEELQIKRVYLDDDGIPLEPLATPDETINVAPTNATGGSFGLKISEGVIYQKGHFLFVAEQLIIGAKYVNVPDNISFGFAIDESFISYLQDETLLDNATGSPNRNAPGADRLKLSPRLVVKPTQEAVDDPDFFILAKYSGGVAVLLRDVSQYNVIGEEMARRTYEESGDYVSQRFVSNIIEEQDDLYVTLGPGSAYVKGYRVENKGTYKFKIDPIETTTVQANQPVSIDYGNYLIISNPTYSGLLPITSYSNVYLSDESGTFGTAIVKNVTPNRVYICNVRMNAGRSFDEVLYIGGISGYIEVTPVTQYSNKGAFVFETGEFSLTSIENISLPMRKMKTDVSVSSGTTTINADPGYDFSVQNSDILVVDNSNVYKEATATAISNNSVLQIDLSDSGFTGTVSVYYNIRKQVSEPHNKVSKETYIKTSYSSAVKKYNLGFPDVYKIVSITDSADEDVTDSFRLIKNQNDHFYDHSYIEYIVGRREPSAGLMTVQLKVFELDTSTGSYYFNVNSYPEDLQLTEIPSYKSSSGKTYNLRECFDFRPYVDPVSGADYDVTDPNLAPTIDPEINIAPVFSGSSFVIPALNSTAFGDIESYVSRKDIIAVDSYGNFSYQKGDEAVNSIAPLNDEKMTIVELSIPGWPVISPNDVITENDRNYAIKITARGTKTYKMKDIQRIDNSIKMLTYYTSLNALESETQNINVTDEYGLTRFKNGIMVDSFRDLNIADVANPQFNAAVEPAEKVLMPTIKTIPLNMVVKDYSETYGSKLHPSAVESTVTGDSTGDIATLLPATEEVELIKQPYATNVRNCVSNFYSYIGKGFLFPEYDSSPDVITNPAINYEIDLVSPFQDFIDNVQELNPLLFSNTSAETMNIISSNTQTNPDGTTIIDTTRTFTSTQNALALSEETNTTAVGDFVTNVQFNPFMRAKTIHVAIYGLRPNTRHWVFFDGINVSDDVAPAAAFGHETGSSLDLARDIRQTGAVGESVESDSNGSIFFIYNMPGNTFYVGDREMVVVDVDQYSSISSAATSKGILTYRAYNFSTEKTPLTISTRTPDFDVNTTTTERTVTSRVVREPRGEREEGGGDIDPIAQTFFIKRGMADNSSSVFARSIDLYFKSKSNTAGVTVELREVINGYPSYQIIPFSKVHLTSSEINVSTDGSVATNVKFQAPVRLDVEKEYSFVVIPDGASPDYLIYTSKVGGIDLSSSSPVTQDWGDGVLFTSTNNRAWESYQDEDVKFTLYRSNFTTEEGTINLTNDNHEFLSIENPVGIFHPEEIVYKQIGSTISGISVQSGNNVISGTNMSSYFSAGDYIILDGTSVERKIYTVIDSSTSTVTLDGPAIGTGTGTAEQLIAGRLSYYNKRKPNFIALETSSTKPGKIFSSGDTLIGFVSGATATITSVDDVMLSYFQPMINRTTETVTSITASGLFTNPDNPDASYTLPVQFGKKTHFNLQGVQLRSKSNDLDRNSPFEITLNLKSNQSSTATPVVDIETAMLFAYQYQITNDPDTTSKYISKEVDLAEGLDAEDFVMYLTAYKPLGTNIKTYIKVRHNTDSTPMDSLDWIELETDTNCECQYSSTSNLNDFREYIYKVPDSVKSGGAIQYTTDVGTFSGYKKFQIRIDLLSETPYRAPKVSDYRGIAVT